MNRRPEKSIYPLVEKWMKRHFLCFKAAINTGLMYSRIDVVGVRDVGGDLSGDVETIAIEVKKSGSPFATTSGQTLGYKVYANRVYLAEERKEPFSPEETDIASELGIGLIQIREGACNEVRSSPLHTPISRLNLLLLEHLGLGRCQFCGCFFNTDDEKLKRPNVADQDILKAIKQEKGLRFWNWEVAERKKKLGLRAGASPTYERRFICPDCVWQLLTVQEKRIRGWFSDHSAESVRKLLAIQEKKIKAWFARQ